MAKQIQGVLGGFSGRVGSVIGYRRGGRWCMRSMPASVYNPRTEAQQRHRSLFRAEVQLAARMRWPIVMALSEEARRQHMTAQNLFVKMNHCCFDSVDFTVDYSRLQLSLGRLAPVAVTRVAVEPLCGARSVGSEDYAGGRAMTLSVSFEPCAGYRYDEVYLYAYSPSAGAGYLFNSVYRHTKKVSVVLPEWLQTSDLQLYLMCRNSRGEWLATVHADLAHHPDDKEEESILVKNFCHNNNFSYLCILYHKRYENEFHP